MSLTLHCFIPNRNEQMSVLSGALWDKERVHSEICKMGQFVLLRYIILSFLCPLFFPASSHGNGFVSTPSNNYEIYLHTHAWAWICNVIKQKMMECINGNYLCNPYKYILIKVIENTVCDIAFLFSCVNIKNVFPFRIYAFPGDVVHSTIPIQFPQRLIFGTWWQQLIEFASTLPTSIMESCLRFISLAFLTHENVFRKRCLDCPLRFWIIHEWTHDFRNPKVGHSTRFKWHLWTMYLISAVNLAWPMCSG